MNIVTNDFSIKSFYMPVLEHFDHRLLKGVHTITGKTF